MKILILALLASFSVFAQVNSLMNAQLNAPRNKPVGSTGFLFDAKVTNSPVKDAVAKFLIVIPTFTDVRELSYSVKNFTDLSEPSYTPAAIRPTALGHELDVAVGSLPRGFYRLYVKIKVKNKDGTETEYYYKSKYKDYLNFEIEKNSAVKEPDATANYQGMSGVDSDMDGIRDDIQIWANLKGQKEPNLRKALEQISRAFQMKLNVSGDKELLPKAAEKHVDAVSCMMGHLGVDEFQTFWTDLRGMFLNTSSRVVADRIATMNYSGSSSEMPSTTEAQKGKCEFH